MIGVTILASCVGMLLGIVALMAGFADSYTTPFPCRVCAGLWLATMSVAAFVVAAHPQWIVTP